MTTARCEITIVPDVSGRPSFDQRYYHVKAPLVRGEQYFCVYGDDADKFGFDKLLPPGQTIARLLCTTLGVRQFTIHPYDVGVLKGVAFDWDEVEVRVVAAILFGINGGSRFLGGLRYANEIPNEYRLATWGPVAAQYRFLCREAGIEPQLLPSPELRSIDLDSHPPGEPEINSE